MTHTIADAEAAVARHPTDLEQLSMAADLLIEAGDPRGEDFAACLAGDLSAEEVMRRHPVDVTAMYYAAWVMERGVIRCKKCGGSGRAYVYTGHGDHEEGDCWHCTDGIDVGVAAAARAEALRLLAECGKVGEHGHRADSYPYWSIPEKSLAVRIPDGWWNRTSEHVGGDGLWAMKLISARLALLDAYATADPDTRRRWAEETRKLAVKEVPA